MTPIDIVFLAYRSERWVVPCLDALARVEYPHASLHIHLLDNAGGDDALAKGEAWWAAHPGAFGSFATRQNGANLGFSGGNNIGWRMGQSPLVLFLNLDTEPEPGFLTPLVDALALWPQAGIAGSKLYFPGTRRLQHAGGIVYANGMADHRFNGEEDRGQADRTTRVDFVTGACLLARRSLLEKLGGFDEDFNPAYYEETDLCRRAARLGSATLYVPESVVIHHESASLGGRRDPRFLRAMYRNRMRLVLNHWTLADLVERWLPAERWWFGMVESKAARPYQWRGYAQALAYWAARTLQPQR